MDIFEVLRTDHRATADLLMRLMAVDDVGTGARLFDELKTALDEHGRAEEALVYSVLTETGGQEDEDLAAAAKDEHEQLDQLVYELEDCDFGDKRWDERLMDLERTLKAHVDMEETKIFARLGQLLDGQSEERLGRAVHAAEPAARWTKVAPEPELPTL